MCHALSIKKKIGKNPPKYLSHNLFYFAYTEKLHRNIRDDLNDMQVVKKVKETVLTQKTHIKQRNNDDDPVTLDNPRDVRGVSINLSV